MKSSLLIISFLLVALSNAFCQEVCLKSAWDAYNKRNWMVAIQHAEDCTFSFGPNALQIQNQLKKNNYKLPEGYNVSKKLTPQQKDEIFSHGLLNDVATSYWIIGMANLRLNKVDAAKKAFQKATELSFGLCYDPNKELFWSPSEDANLRL